MSEAELERFRREWREEVRARERGAGNSPTGVSANARLPPIPAAKLGRKAPASQRIDVEDDRVAGGVYNFDDLEEREENRKLGVSGEAVHPEALQKKEPSTALEHYEHAVEHEKQGKLGESLAHYRRAFHLNERVHQQYKNKYFPPTAYAAPSKSSKQFGQDASTAVQSPNQGLPEPNSVIGGKYSELMASYSHEPITGVPPIIERDIAPPCPIARMPSEILTEILRCCAVVDIASYVRLSLVCKRLAYLVAADEMIWKEVCLESKFGFNAMHFEFKDSRSEAALNSDIIADIEKLNIGESLGERPPENLYTAIQKLSSAYPSYATMFRRRPRLRYGGVYISTVNYIRPGAAAPHQFTSNSPVHIVTYYRYLRFYRDGSCISLLSTVEPLDVVPHLHVENIGETAGAIASPGLGAVGKYTLRGRWKMSAPNLQQDKPGAADEDEGTKEPEGNVVVETDGPRPCLVYNMQLALRSNSGKGAKNTKLVWRNFWSYNKITDDWAEFQLRNDRAYVWSRVKSWSDA